jgi:hypothetical protein
MADSFTALITPLVIQGGPSHPIAPGGGQPVDPGYGLPEGPVDPGYGVELPPIAAHPIAPTPGHPIELPPTYPVDPDYGLPIAPDVWPQPPKPVDPGYGVSLPIAPEFPIYLPPAGTPEHPIALPPGSVWPPLPPAVTGKLLAFMWIVGVGYRWVCIDTSLKPAQPIQPPSSVPQPQPVRK